LCPPPPPGLFFVFFSAGYFPPCGKQCQSPGTVRGFSPPWLRSWLLISACFVVDIWVHGPRAPPTLTGGGMLDYFGVGPCCRFCCLFFCQPSHQAVIRFHSCVPPHPTHFRRKLPPPISPCVKNVPLRYLKLPPPALRPAFVSFPYFFIPNSRPVCCLLLWRGPLLYFFVEPHPFFFPFIPRNEHFRP